MWIKNKNKKILIHLANQNLCVILDSLRNLKIRESKWIDSVRALGHNIQNWEII